MRKNTVYANERGSVFIIALLLIVFISIISIALITLTGNTLQITKHERTDQAVFYIAEADLNIKRADINSELEGIFQAILDSYKDKVLDLEKINEDYLTAAVTRLNSKLDFNPITSKKEYEYAEVKSYEHQNGHEPSSQVKLLEGPESNSYTLESTADIDGITRTISQTFSIKLPDILTEPGDETPTDYNFCFGVLANSFTTTNTYNTDSDVVSLNDLTINNTGTFEKNIYAKGALTITNTATVKGDIITFGNFKSTNGTTYNNIYSKGSMTFTNDPKVNGNLVALSDIYINGGGSYKRDIISNGGIYFKTTNGSVSSPGNIFAMNDILIEKSINPNFIYSNRNITTNVSNNVKGSIFGKQSIKSLLDWNSGLGSKRYSMGDIIYSKGDTKTNIRAKNEAEFNQFLINENVNLNDYLEPLNKLKNIHETPGNNGECGVQSFVNAQIPTAPKFLSIVDDSLLTMMSDISIGSNNTLSLMNDGYIKNISINSNATLTIDVGEQDQTLVVDRLTAGNGHIQIKGTGKLNILVRNSLSFVNFLSSNERSPFDTTIYYEGPTPVEIKKKLESSLYTNNSNVNISGDGHVSGNLIVGGNQTINISGNTKFGDEKEHIVILVPNSTLKFSGSSSIYGTIIGNKVDAVGSNTTHKYDKSKLNLDLFAPSKKPSYSSEGGFLDPQPQKEI
ncbi:hypothetical protein ACIQ2D_01865 [Lysinibacillus sp. NPDC097287]|uniref:hypothetical protein n=1 Tax=Lysinibacillus sp. NPDC097287 TaxID=3364144 RepID=UPI003809B814